VRYCSGHTFIAVILHVAHIHILEIQVR